MANPAKSAALDAKTRGLFAEWDGWKQRHAAHVAAVAKDRARLPLLLAEHVAAQVDGAPKRAQGLLVERAEIEQRLATADQVEAGLRDRITASGLAWSSAWTAWSDAVKVELFEPLEAKRAALARAEAAAQQEYARRVGEMPA